MNLLKRDYKVVYARMNDDGDGVNVIVEKSMFPDAIVDKVGHEVGESINRLAGDECESVLAGMSVDGVLLCRGRAGRDEHSQRSVSMPFPVSGSESPGGKVK